MCLCVCSYICAMQRESGGVSADAPITETMRSHTGMDALAAAGEPESPRLMKTGWTKRPVMRCRRELEEHQKPVTVTQDEERKERRVWGWGAAHHEKNPEAKEIEIGRGAGI